jgi:CubicO group peptidase (beta-lactamase class C family)
MVVGKAAEVRNLSEAIGSAAVLIIYDGVVLAEWGEVERRFRCHSLRKSILSALYGVAVERGQIDLDENLGALGIDDDIALTAEEKTAKISDLLKARSGVYLPAAYETKRMSESRPKRGSQKPGRHWYYNNWDFNALATIYNRKTRGDLFKAFKSQFAEPLQMQDFDLRHTYYHLEAHNSRHPAYPFRMSARDLARFGLLFLNEGAWNGHRFFSADWVRESTKAYSWSKEFGTAMAICGGATWGQRWSLGHMPRLATAGTGSLWCPRHG